MREMRCAGWVSPDEHRADGGHTSFVAPLAGPVVRQSPRDIHGLDSLDGVSVQLGVGC